jgi:5-methylcytosine-specific restriction endonuclease McrA
MARKAIPRGVRRRVRVRAGQRCEYCRHPDGFACAPFACEHVLPRSLGAGDSVEELAWSCSGCNSHKSDKTSGLDPVTGRTVPLYNPRTQDWGRHFRWSSDGLLIIGSTATGRATVETLHLNRPELVNLRFLLSTIAEHPPED